MAEILDLSSISLWIGTLLIILTGGYIFYFLRKRRRIAQQPTVDIQTGWGPKEKELLVPLKETVENAVAKRRLSEEAYRSYDDRGGGELLTVKDIVVQVMQAMRDEEGKKEFMDKPDLNKFLEKKILQDVWTQAVNMKYEFVKDVQILGATVKVSVSNKEDVPEEVVPEELEEVALPPKPDTPVIPKQPRKRRSTKVPTPPVIEEEVEEEEESEALEEDEESDDEIYNLKD